MVDVRLLIRTINGVASTEASGITRAESMIAGAVRLARVLGAKSQYLWVYRCSTVEAYLLEVPDKRDSDIILEKIPIKPQRSDQRIPGASGTFQQGQDYDCYIGRIDSSLKLETRGIPKIWIWAQGRCVKTHK